MRDITQSYTKHKYFATFARPALPGPVPNIDPHLDASLQLLGSYLEDDCECCPNITDVTWSLFLKSLLPERYLAARKCLVDWIPRGPYISTTHFTRFVSTFSYSTLRLQN